MLHAISVHVSSDLLVAVSFGLRVDNGYWDDTGAVTPADLKLHIVTYTYFSCIFVRNAVQFLVNHWTYVLAYILEVVACCCVCNLYVKTCTSSCQCCVKYMFRQERNPCNVQKFPTTYHVLICRSINTGQVQYIHVPYSTYHFLPYACTLELSMYMHIMY